MLLVPVVLLSGLMLHGLFEAERERLWRAAHDRARAITIVLERDLASRIAALQALAASPELDEAVPEPSMLEGFARRRAPSRPCWTAASPCSTRQATSPTRAARPRRAGTGRHCPASWRCGPMKARRCGWSCRCRGGPAASGAEP
ncbi:hypothetical protein [Teichococcus aestuarii]|uniref:hypothetical protein n=1 Tax=Teichococcus aestuarii TaxID=568898 RepID=UPI00360F03D7